MSRLAKVSREAFAQGFQPVTTLIVFAVWWWLPWRETNPLESAAVVLFIANALIYALELAISDVPEWSTTGRDSRIDLFYILARLLVISPVFQIFVLLSIEPLLQGILPIWPNDWPLLARIVLALFLGDTIGFIVHRAMHTYPALWRFHATHHAQVKLNSARWSANHPIEYVLINLPIVITIAILGPDLTEVAGAIVLGRMTVVFAHSNLPLRSSVFSLVFTSPDQHRRHHALGQDTRVNYGDALIILDRIAGSFDSGTTRSVGVGAGADLALKDQLLLPWRLSKIDEPPIDLRKPATKTVP